MKRDEKAELRNKSIEELKNLVNSKNQEIVKLRMVVKGSKNLTGEIKKVRKQVAVMQTIINEKVNKVQLRTR